MAAKKSSASVRKSTPKLTRVMRSDEDGQPWLPAESVPFDPWSELLAVIAIPEKFDEHPTDLLHSLARWAGAVILSPHGSAPSMAMDFLEAMEEVARRCGDDWLRERVSESLQLCREVMLETHKKDTRDGHCELCNHESAQGVKARRYGECLYRLGQLPSQVGSGPDTGKVAARTAA